VASGAILVTDQVFGDFGYETDEAADAGFELIVLDGDRRAMLNVRQPDRVLAIYNTYYGPVDGELMDAFGRLRGIVRCGIGVDTIDLAAASQRGLLVANVPDYCIEEVASHALAMFLALVRRLRPADTLVRAGKWSIPSLKPIRALSRLTVGVVGLGRIGLRFAEMVGPLAGRTVYYDPLVRSSSADQVDLDTLFEVSDAISLHVPLTEQTQGMINREVFGRLKKTPLLINVSRGGLVVTDDLVEALREGLISGAGFDVVDGLGDAVTEHAMFGFDNVVLSPHSAWYSEASIGRLRASAIAEAIRLARGETPDNRVV